MDRHGGRQAVSARLDTVTAERRFVSAGLGWVCCICRTLFVGRPRVGFVTCPTCSDQLDRRGEA